MARQVVSFFAALSFSVLAFAVEQQLPVLSQAEYEILTAQQKSAYVGDFKTAWLSFASNFQNAASAPQRLRRSDHYNRTSWTPKQYGQTATDAKAVYSSSCQNGANQAACSTLLKDIEAATPQDGRCKILDAGNGHRIQIPPFGLTKEYRCAFNANVPLLKKVVENGCKEVDPKTAPSNDLFTTTFEASTGVSLLGPSNVFEGIVEDVQEQDGHFIVQMLKPNMTAQPVSLERVSFVVRKMNGIYLLRLPTGSEVEVKITNNSRKNIMPRFMPAKGGKVVERTALSQAEKNVLDRFHDSSVLLASNCKLSEGLKKLNVYQSSPSGSSAAPAGKPAPTKSSK